LKRKLETRSFWRGIVAENVTDLSDRLSVVVPDFDPNFRWTNCRWQSRDSLSLPIRGDECLVVLDNRGEAWVISWWPFSQ
jgi:hypothetical protein